MAFHGQCEGLAGVELRGNPFRADRERLWRYAIQALLNGLARQLSPVQ